MNIQLLAFARPTNRRIKPLFAMAAFALGLAIFGPQTALAQDEDEEPLVVKMYDVQDLISISGNQPFEGFVLPGIKELSQWPHGFGGGFGGGGFGGGQGGGGVGGQGGGGVFNIAPTTPDIILTQGGGFGGSQLGGGYARDVAKVDMLSELIVGALSEDTWQDYGNGFASIQTFGNVLVISQTETVHAEIEAFLSMLRDVTERKQQTINVKAIWLTINETQLETLDPQSNQIVDKEILKKLAAEHGRRAQITCFNGQTVHVAAGNLKSSVESVVPVVGLNELEFEKPTQIAKAQPKKAKLPKHIMAQVSSSPQEILEGGNGGQTAQQGVGYQPVGRWINYGSLLQITPIVRSKTEIEIDLSSIVVTPGPKLPGIDTGSITVDRHDLHVQQFLSTCRLNVGTPTLVGGSTFGSEGDSELQTYLIIEATPVVLKPSE